MKQSNIIRQEIASLGNELGPQVLSKVLDLYEDEQQTLVKKFPATAKNISYGNHERHVFDVYAPSNPSDKPVPVIVFVHGGGFLKGDKGSDEHWHNSNVGRMAAQAGFLGIVMNYRLAPDFIWPSGGEDVAAAIKYLNTKVSKFGGDPERIFLMGTSAGSVHITTYLQLYPELKNIRAAILLSGLYGFTPLDERDTLYYGDHFLYSSRMPLNAISQTRIPLLLTCAEFDPPRFQTEFSALLQKRIITQGQMPRAMIVSGHNHYSLSIHLGTRDTRLADEIFSFIEDNS
ncbi:carboxylesterase family protein [Aurantivibrio infirmus]